MTSSKLLVASLVVVVLGQASSGVSGGQISWSVSATLELVAGADVLGVAGETVTLTALFDDQAVWQQESSSIRVPTVGSSMTVTGPHSGSFIVGSIASSPPFGTAVLETLPSNSYADIVLDGQTLVGIFFVGPHSVTPDEGNVLKATHLPQSIDPSGFFRLDSTNDYVLANAEIRISHIPEVCLLSPIWLLLLKWRPTPVRCRHVELHPSRVAT